MPTPEERAENEIDLCPAILTAEEAAQVRAEIAAAIRAAVAEEREACAALLEVRARGLEEDAQRHEGQGHPPALAAHARNRAQEVRNAVADIRKRGEG